jgi:hypothetical protein
VVLPAVALVPVALVPVALVAVALVAVALVPVALVPVALVPVALVPVAFAVVVLVPVALAVVVLADPVLLAEALAEPRLLFTIVLKSAPARNFGTEVLGTLTAAPVAGLRAVRAGRTCFSKTPNPVIVTLSPPATVSWIVSMTALTASVAVFRFPILS